MSVVRFVCSTWLASSIIVFTRDSRTQASNFRRVLGCPGSPRFHSQKAVRWLPVTGGDRASALQLSFLGPIALPASAEGGVPRFRPKRKAHGLCTRPAMLNAWEPGNSAAEGRG